jgi:hypothetical protein
LSEGQEGDILSIAKNWQLIVDLGKKLVFPPRVETAPFPAIFREYKELLVIELTVP